MAGEGLYLRQVMRRNENGRFRGALQHSFNQFVTNQRVQSAEGFIEDNQFGVICERTRKRSLHPHAARQMLELPIQWQCKLQYELVFQISIP